MALDPSIILQGQQIRDPLESYGKALSLKSLAAQQQMQANQLADYEQEKQQQQTLADLYRSSATGGQLDRGALISGAAQRGLGARIPGLQKSFADLDKSQADVGHIRAQTDESQVKAQKQRLDIAGGTISSLLSNPNVSHQDVIGAVSNLVNQGVLQPEQGAQMVRSLPGSPQGLRQFLLQQGLQTMDATKRLEALMPQRVEINNGKQITFADKNPLTNPDGAGLSVQRVTTPGEDLGAATTRAGQAVTMRGQNMADARARESNSAALSKPFEVTGPDGQPMLVQQDKQGGIRPVQGFSPKGMGATKLTEDQGKATGWLSQATNAFDNMQAAIAGNPGAAKPGIADAVGRIPGLGALGNQLQGADRQKYMQASSSMSEALLRAATGAGVNESEARQKVTELTPQFGDSDEVIRQKMDAIPVYIESLKVRAGPGAKQVPEIMSKARGQSSGPKAGAVEDGYVYLGGDPSKPESWKKK